MGNTINFNWDYKTQGKNPWFTDWANIFQAIDTDLYNRTNFPVVFSAFSEDTTPTSSDLVITAAGEKVTIGNLFRNLPDGSASAPGLAFGTEQHLGPYYVPGDPGVVYWGHDGFNGMRFNIGSGHWDFYGSVAAGGGQGKIGIFADELQIGIIDDGPTHQNGDIALYCNKSVIAVIRPELTLNARTLGCFKMRETWTIAGKDYAPFVIQRGYPAADSYGDWAFVNLIPDYSRLTGVEDGYSLLYMNPTHPASGASRQLFWRFEKSSVLKSEMDIDGKLNLQNGIIGDLTIAGIATGEVVAIYPQGTTGATTYGYKVSYINGSGINIASAELTIANGNATLNGTNYNVVCAKHVAGATSIKFYRTTGGATQGLIGTVTAPNSDGKWRINDTGLAAGGEVPETTNTTGKVNIQWALAFAEVVNAPTAVANKAIVFAQDNGAGKTQLMVQFPSGVAQQIAIEA